MKRVVITGVGALSPLGHDWATVRARLKEERERAVYAFEARVQAIGRIGLPAVREHRRKRLQQEHGARMAALDDMEASVPDLNAVMMVRVGQVG